MAKSSSGAEADQSSLSDEKSPELQNPFSAPSALTSNSRCSQLHRMTLRVYAGSTTKSFPSVWNYLRRAVPQFPCPSPHCPNAFFWTFTSRVAKENKHVGSWQHTLESLSHPFSRWEALEGKQERNNFFSFSINFHFFQVWVNSGHRATRMIWLRKLLISPSKESRLLATEQSARSSKGLLQHDLPGFLWGHRSSGYNLWPLPKT